jgi:acetyltransferase-like isoleucine patch superfamily enzyme
MPWYFHNLFTYIARYTFLEFATPSPFNVLFYRAMGMKMGKNVNINTVNISDPSMLELGKNVVLGGSASVICHYASSGFLIVAPVKIGDGATIGMKSTVMGDVHIGEGARLLPNSVLMPKSRVPAHEIWGGVPAVYIGKTRKGKALEEAAK